jgi:hypothetical protein
MTPAFAVNKALSLVAIFAIAVLAGCSSPSPESSPTTGKRLTGTMDEWVNAVCIKSPLPMKRGRMLGNSKRNPTVCRGVAPGSQSEMLIITAANAASSCRSRLVDLDLRRLEPASRIDGLADDARPKVLLPLDL